MITEEQAEEIEELAQEVGQPVTITIAEVRVKRDRGDDIYPNDDVSYGIVMAMLYQAQEAKRIYHLSVEEEIRQGLSYLNREGWERLNDEQKEPWLQMAARRKVAGVTEQP